MKKSKLKLSLKVALASTIVATSAAALVYVTPGIIKTVAETNETELILDVQNIDQDTLKISIDNIEDIPKAIQFSIKLNGIVPKKSDDGNILIENLIGIDQSEESGEIGEDTGLETLNELDNLITDYTYNEENNTIDVLITSKDSIPKNANKVEVFKLDIEKDSENTGRTYSVTVEENEKYKYVSNSNKEYVTKVEVLNNELTINTAPTIVKQYEKYIEIEAGDEILLTKDGLSKYIEANDGEEDEITFEVKNANDEVINKFTTNTAGIYDLYVTAIDSFGAKSETLKIQVKVNELEQNPIITKDGKALEDVTINAGEIFGLMDGVEAVDGFGNPVNVTVKADDDLDLDPDTDKTYNITYTAIDSNGRTTEVTIQLTVKANKAPVIKGVKDHILTVGDTFDPRKDVTVEDEDENIELVVESNVNTKVADVYKVIYKATDSGNKTTIVQSVVVVNPKNESDNSGNNGNGSDNGNNGSDNNEKNSIPVINAKDLVIQLGEEFNPLNGVSATDEEDGPISNINVVRNEVINNIAGKYTVTYSATDSKGASAIKTITVIVNDPPKIIAEDKVIKLGGKFNPLSGVKAIDKEDENITKIDVIENNVDENTEGKYTVTYSVEDSLGGKATKTINVTVKKDIVLAENITINDKINSLYVGSSKILTASVDKAADLKDIEWSTSDESIASIEIIGNDVKVIAKKEGKVTITAKTKDGSDKSDSITIDILNYEDNVTDFIKDVIDTSVVVPVLGTGDIDSPLEMEVKNVTIEKFDEFLTKVKKLNPILIDKLEYEDFTLYKIKVENTSGLAKVLRLFKASTSNEGYINIKIANKLDNESSLKTKLEDILTYEDNSDDTGNTGGSSSSNAGSTGESNSGNAENAGGSNSGDTGSIGGSNSSNAGNAGGSNLTNTENEGESNSINAGNEGESNLGNTENPGESDSGNTGSAGGSNSGDINTEDENGATKSHTTSKKSIIVYVGLAIIAASTALIKKRKNKKI